jgi:hypothetical protein
MTLGARPEQAEPRWLAVLAVLAVGGIVMALPAPLTLGPRWLVLVLVAGLLVPTVIAQRRGQHALSHVLGLGVNSLVTVALVGSLALLIQALPTRQETPEALLGSAAALWVTNILVFASWYWRLDAGGPHQRDRRPEHVDGAFLFPQMTMDAAAKAAPAASAWSPGFVDYLFLAFNTSTALSPTDAPVLSPWAKLLMMLQATISLTIVVLLAARAVNIL